MKYYCHLYDKLFIFKYLHIIQRFFCFLAELMYIELCMCSLNKTVNNHSTEETDVVQHNEETCEDSIMILLFFLSRLTHFIWLLENLCFSFLFFF